MGQRSAVIHCNTRLDHQVKIAEALRAGFERHDKYVSISSSANDPADLHICMGPWFAFDKWKNHNTLYIDRAYWGDPECISIHWLVGGEKLFTQHNPDRRHPDLKPMKSGDRTIYLCDYADKSSPISGVDVRLHPARSKSSRTLQDDLDSHDIAIGKRTTALVDAAINGLTVKTEDPFSPVYRLAQGELRESWIRDLAWHNWSLEEIANGDMWNVFDRDK